MSPQDFQNLRNAFEQILAAPDLERPSLIACYPPETACELERMLAAHRNSASLLDVPAADWLPATSDTPLAHGALLGPYRIDRELGIGGMGVVYLATRTDGTFDRRVAIKVLRSDRFGALFADRFQQERRILAQLNHPHIASILDAGETPAGDPYFVMEYVDGIPITEYCSRNALSVDRKLELFLQVCDAVQHAHRNLTVHRDLKPGNVLVTPPGAVKLLDFGIAKLLDPPAGPVSDHAASTVLLTPEYSAPEQIRREPITTATDVFALGVLLYELLTEDHPFRRSAAPLHEVMRAICEDDPPAGRIRGDLQAIVLTALRKDPAWRYPSVDQLAEDVRRYRRGWPVLTKGDRLGYRIRKFVRRQWLPITAAALLILSLTAGIATSTHEARLADQARVTADKARASAEKERQRAEAQRILAQQASLVAFEQKSIAETRTREAEHERLKERERYRDVRALASSLLFDLYDGVRDLAGSTTARRLIVAKVQRQLEVLRADDGDDIGLRRDLAACYERMGELRVDPRHPDKNDAAAALDSYRQAIDLRRKIAAQKGALPSDRRDLALSLSRLGEGLLRAGDAKTAVATYRDAWNLAESLVHEYPADSSAARALGAIDERRCIVLLTAGDTIGALGACREGIATLKPLAAQLPPDLAVQRFLATTEASYANALRLSQKPKEAEVQARTAVAVLARLETLAPNNAEYRRLASSAQTILAGALASNGDIPASLDAFRRSVESMHIALEIDPDDLGSSLRLAVALLAFSARLDASGNRDAGHDAARESLQLFAETAAKPSAGAVEWNEYANALLKVNAPDLRDATKALRLAQSAVSATKRRNPFFLDTLAWAFFRSSDSSKAADVEREALALLPPEAAGGLHDELTAALKTFQQR